MALINLGKTDHDISLDLQTLISTRLLIQASSGGGKSYAIRRLLEQSHGRIQQLVIDLEGEFLTLREHFDYVIAGKGGDAPADMKSVKLLALKLLELEVSAICDISELKKHERFSFVKVFLESLISAPRSLWHPVLVVIDEAHQWCPQTGQAESANAVIDLCTRGRKRGYCAVLATQRLSKLHKDACAELQNKMIGRTSLDIDQKRAADELGMSGREDRIGLRKLNPGDFHVYGPALRCGKESTGEVVLMHVAATKSKHPEVGKRTLETLPKPTDKIKQILGQLANLPEIAEREQKDIQALQQENTDLKRKLTLAAKDRPEPKPCNHEPIIRSQADHIKLLEGIARSTDSFFKQIYDGLSGIGKSLDPLIGIAERARLVIKEADEFKPETPSKSPALNNQRSNPGFSEKPKRAIAKLSNTIISYNDNSELTAAHQRILNALAALEQFGIGQPTKSTLAAHSGYRPGSGGYNNNLSSLRVAGLIDYPVPGCVGLTDLGRGLARVDNPISSIADLHRSWLGIIRSKSQRDILEALIALYPNDISKIDLAQTVNKQSGSGGYNNNLSGLRTLGAIDYPTPGRVKASNLLFPEGLS